MPHKNRPAIPAEIARSWLLVPGTRPEAFAPASTSHADQIILDIEDAVDPKLKPAARNDVVEWLSGGGSGWVRINDHSTDFWSDDVDALAGIPGVVGVMLAKT
jgi:citrate lyase subunit beta/citryl-CoA lyase